MDISDAHKDLLMHLGLCEADFDRFDGTFVTYEFDEKKGVRLYDPYYQTSYEEYIGIDGWSAWSTEDDSFMTDILKPTHDTVNRIKTAPPKAEPESVPETLEKKFAVKKQGD